MQSETGRDQTELFSPEQIQFQSLKSRYERMDPSIVVEAFEKEGWYNQKTNEIDFCMMKESKNGDLVSVHQWGENRQPEYQDSLEVFVEYLRHDSSIDDVKSLLESAKQILEQLGAKVFADTPERKAAAIEDGTVFEE